VVSQDALPLDPDLDPLRARTLLLVFLGGCLGGAARYGVSRGWPMDSSYAFPWATLVVNLSGAFALAVLVVAVVRRWHGLDWPRRFFGTGFLGAWTTFSAVAVSVDQLLAHHHAGTAVAYLAASLVGGVACAGLGLVVGSALSRRFAG
jgi:fluoride exporter